MFLVAIPIVLVAIVAVDYLIHSLRCGKLIDRIPGPICVPIIGNLLALFGSAEHVYFVMEKWAKQYRPIYRLWRMHWPVVILMDPDDAEALLTSNQHLEKNDLYEYLESWLGKGLLTSAGTKWHTRRKLLTPSFHFRMLKSFVQTFDENSKKLVKSMKETGEGDVQDLVPLFMKHTLNVICETAMGTKLDRMELSEEYRNAVFQVIDGVMYRSLRPWMYYDWIFNLTPVGRKHGKVLEALHRFTNRIISERKKYHENMNWKVGVDDLENENELQDLGLGRKRLAMLDLLISLWHEGRIDDDGIREEVDTFIFEGHDTTTMALVCLVANLAENKKYQDQCREEVEAVMKGCNGKLGMSELQELSRLEGCIKESLRMFPSVPKIFRQVNKDLQLKKYLIPKGSSMGIDLVMLQRNPNVWPNPETFDPDRFLGDRVTARHPFAFIPFSAGSRNCIGQKFALMEIKSIVAHLLHHYYVEPVDSLRDVRFQVDMVLRPVGPVRVKFIPIKH